MSKQKVKDLEVKLNHPINEGKSFIWGERFGWVRVDCSQSFWVNNFGGFLSISNSWSVKYGRG